MLPLRFGAGEEPRTPDLNSGKVMLYQLSYSRKNKLLITLLMPMTKPTGVGTIEIVYLRYK
jgi:hypothetical protein